MKHLFSRYYMWVILLALASACQKNPNSPLDKQAVVRVTFDPVVSGQPLMTGNAYKNAFNETYQVGAFKFYVNKIELIKTNNEAVRLTNEHYLIDAGRIATQTIPLAAGEGSYKAIAFTIGVDSARNVSGAQTGALDPAVGMFWTWNSGYIMAKLEGTSPVSTEPNNRFEYHIGGFKGTENVVKRIEVLFPSANTLSLSTGKTASIFIAADANAWFDAVNDLSIQAQPVCMTPGPLAKAFAENYYHMFTVTATANN